MPGIVLGTEILQRMRKSPVLTWLISYRGEKIISKVISTQEGDQWVTTCCAQNEYFDNWSGFRIMSGLQKTETGRRAFQRVRKQSQKWENIMVCGGGKIGSSVWNIRKTSLKRAIESQVVKDNIINRNIMNLFMNYFVPII